MPPSRRRRPRPSPTTLTASSRAEGHDPKAPDPRSGPTPDVSLTDAGSAYSHKGLTYPLGRRGPAEGELIELADGVGWARLPMPGSLKHINIWVLEEESGVALVDTGIDLPASREAWEALLTGPLAGRTITRVI